MVAVLAVRHMLVDERRKEDSKRTESEYEESEESEEGEGGEEAKKKRNEEQT